MLNFSVFESDDTLGSANPDPYNYHQFTAIVEGTPTARAAAIMALAPAVATSTLRQAIEDRLVSEGQIVTAVANASSIFSTQYRFRIDLWVRNEYSAEQSQAFILRVLASLLNISAISVSSTRPTGGGNPQTQLPPQQSYPPANPIGTPPPAGPQGPDTNALGGFFDSLGASMGISAPIAIVGGGLVLLLILRR